MLVRRMQCEKAKNDCSAGPTQTMDATQCASRASGKTVDARPLHVFGLCVECRHPSIADPTQVSNRFKRHLLSTYMYLHIHIYIFISVCVQYVYIYILDMLHPPVPYILNTQRCLSDPP